MIVETDAVVLHAMDYGDTSKIVTLYSKKYGKIKVIAKGARGQKNKFGSSLEPMTIASLVLYKKEQRDLHLLSKSEIALPLSRIQQDSDRMFSGLALIELVNMVMHDEEENDSVYSMIVQSLQALDEATKNHVNVLISFMLKMFEQFGFGLSLDHCIICRKELQTADDPFALIRLSDGKIICSQCYYDGNTNGVRIEGGMLKSLYYLHTTPIAKTTVLTLPFPVKNEIIATVQSYLRYHIESARTLRSLSLFYTTQ